MTESVDTEEALDSRGRNITLAVVAVVAVAIAGLVANNYWTKARWIAAMQGYDVSARRSAATAMMQRGDLSEQLQGETVSVRAAAVRALGEVATPKAAENLVPFMKDADQPVRESAIQQLVAIGPAVSLEKVVEKGFSDSDDAVKKGSIAVCKQMGAVAIEPAAKKLVTDYRKTAAEALVEIKNKDGSLKPRIVAVVAPYAGEQNPIDPAKPNLEESRNQAIDVLDRAGDETAVPTLIQALEFSQTRRAAVGALGRKKDPRATQPLVRWLPLDDTVRHETVIALGQIADSRGIEPLVAEGLSSVSDSVRSAAADSLRSIGSPAIPSLRRVLAGAGRYSSAQRAGAARALGGMHDPAATAVALPALRDADLAVRRAAADALGESGSSAIIPTLIASFSDPDPDGRVQSACSRSLARFDRAAVPALVAALAGRDTVRAYWASQTLLLIGRPAVQPLTALLMGKDSETARRAARLLGDLGDASAAGALRRALERNADPEFRFAAATALQRLSEEQQPASG